MMTRRSLEETIIIVSAPIKGHIPKYMSMFVHNEVHNETSKLLLWILLLLLPHKLQMLQTKLGGKIHNELNGERIITYSKINRKKHLKSRPNWIAKIQIYRTELGICSWGACINITTDPTMHNMHPTTPNCCSLSLKIKCVKTALFRFTKVSYGNISRSSLPEFQNST